MTAKILGEKLFNTWEIPRSGSKAEDGENPPGTVGGPGGRDRTLAVKSRKTSEKSHFSPKWVKSKKRRKKREKERKKERPNDGDNNGQAMHGDRKHAWRTQAAWANYNKKWF